MTTTPFTTTGQLAATAGALQTNPAATTTQIKSVFVHNTNTTAETVQIYLVPNASGALGTAALTNRLVYFPLAANETVEVTQTFPWTLANTNDALFAVTTTAAKVTYTVSGVKTS